MADGNVELKATFHVGQNSLNLSATLWVSDFDDEGTISQGIDAATLQGMGKIS